MASMDEFSRERAILAALRATGRVLVGELASQFGVSTVTIRKDLETLERKSLLKRVRGGAVGVGASDEGAFELRLKDSRERKSAIGRAAALLVEDGDVVAIDSSTTSFYLGREILDRRNLVVVTNGLRLATLFMEQSSARVLVLGGVLRRSAASLVGPIGDILTSRGRIAKGFFGVVGLSATHGLMDISGEEAQTKASIARACDAVYGLFDSSKVTGFGLHSFVSPDAITGMYTDSGVPEEFVIEWKRLGVPVTAVPAEARVDEPLALPSERVPRRQ